uniref:Succinate-semialdehyde dehydrogenase n=1 Tax=Blastobotrys adeninivorans TaxID=409370 RepID=A0A060T3V5_BLAAD
MDLIQDKAFINGKFVPSKSGETFRVLNPASDQVIANVSECDVEDAKEAVRAAEQAFASFSKTTARSRARMLRKWFDLMSENSEQLAKIVTMENGKPLAEAKGEVAYSASFLEWFSEEAPRITGDTIPTQLTGTRMFTIRQPIGPCAMLTPWNFPSAMITRKVGAAIAAGCTVVIKPAGETPLSALALAKLAKDAGIPDGVINIVTCDKNLQEVGKELCENPIIKKVSFTGSTRVGKLLMGLSASTLKKLSFELGGNAPFIVFDDCDVDKAVEGAIACKFRHSGQTCICANRLFVHESVYNEFTTKLVQKVVNSLKLGPGMDDGTTHGPLIHKRAVEKVESHVEDAVSKGAKVLVGGKRREDLGNSFFDLTVLGNVKQGMQCTTEETFGPLASIISFSSEQEVLEHANDTPVGLAGYFFTKDLSRMYRVAEELQVGMIGVNTGAISDNALPFGGVGESGFGREGSKYGIDEYLVLKTVTVGI